ncbi:MAG: hypothetical protein J6Y19_11660 [Kiritimatiellae bacterium]|nr:hypothetical protein [Kiritimatiellia bacterium]
MSENKTLLQQIEEEAVASRSDVASLLRKCLVLATRLRNDSLKEWIRCELNGYPSTSELPEYRVVPCQSMGIFYGRGMTLKNAPIPEMCIPETIREDFGSMRFYQGVGFLQDLLENNNGTLISPWPSNLIAMLAQNVYSGMGMLNAQRECPSGAVVKILETIRNRILDFVLELEEDCPNAGEAIGATKPDSKKVEQMVTNNIFKGVGNVALQCGTVSQTNTVNVEKGNWESLAKLLHDIKIDEGQISELQDILQKDPPKSKTNWGTRLSQWFGSICAKAASGLYSVPAETLSGLLVVAISKYLGWA